MKLCRDLEPGKLSTVSERPLKVFKGLSIHPQSLQPESAEESLNKEAEGLRFGIKSKAGELVSRCC